MPRKTGSRSNGTAKSTTKSQTASSVSDLINIPAWLRAAEKIVVDNTVTGATIDDMVRDLLNGVIICADTETTGTNIVDDQLVSIQFCSNARRAWFIPVAMLGMNNFSMSYLAHKLQPIWERGLVFHNAGFDWQFLQRHVDFRIVADTLIEAKCVPDLWIHPRDFSLKGLAKHLLKYDVIEFDKLFPRGTKDHAKRFDLVAQDISIPYACQDPLLTFMLWEHFTGQVDRTHFIYNMEHEVIKPLARMELLGIGLNTSLLSSAELEANAAIDELSKQILGYAAHEFNLNAPAQLAEVLYDQLGLTPPTPTRSTAVEVLHSMDGMHPIIEDVLDYRGINKLKTAFIDKLPLKVASDGNVHCSIHAWGAITGRTSCSEPNLQQIPKPKGKTGDNFRILLRRAFIPPKGFVSLLDQDYSQLEYRLFGSLSQDQALIQAFLNGEDVHKRTAALMFNVAYEDVDKIQRDKGKTANFAAIYGQGVPALAKQWGISEYKAKEILAAYWARMQKAQAYVSYLQQFAKKNLYCETYFGRRRALPYANSRVSRTRAEAEREAVNTPVQGMGGDLIKMAIIRADRYLGQAYKSRLCLTVHDQLITAIHPDDDPQDIAEAVRDAMEIPLEGFVPLLTDAKHGPNWYDTQPLQYRITPLNPAPPTNIGASSPALVLRGASDSASTSPADPPDAVRVLGSEPDLGLSRGTVDVEAPPPSEETSGSGPHGHDRVPGLVGTIERVVQPTAQAHVSTGADRFGGNQSPSELWLLLEGSGPPIDSALSLLQSVPGDVEVHIPFEVSTKDTGVRTRVTPETLFKLRKYSVGFVLSAALKTALRAQVGAA